VLVGDDEELLMGPDVRWRLVAVLFFGGGRLP
jgi:hypothetical protein